jgi:hypothetical protein
MKPLTFQIASLPDRENPVIEIWLGEDQFCEISNENSERPKVEIFQAPSGNSWLISLEDLNMILTTAKANLPKNKD